MLIAGELRPKSRFLGNSVSTIMEGENRVRLLGKPEDGGQSPFPPCVPIIMRHRRDNARWVYAESNNLTPSAFGKRRLRHHDAEHVCAR